MQSLNFNWAFPTVVFKSNSSDTTKKEKNIMGKVVGIGIIIVGVYVLARS